MKNLSATIVTANNRKVLLQTGLFINNSFVPAANGDTFNVSNPGNHQQNLAKVASAGEVDVDKAIKYFSL